jgi:hypothetical protein
MKYSDNPRYVLNDWITLVTSSISIVSINAMASIVSIISISVDYFDLFDRFGLQPTILGFFGFPECNPICNPTKRNPNRFFDLFGLFGRNFFEFPSEARSLNHV